MSELTKLIEENKGKFEIIPEELEKRIEKALSRYSLIVPVINLEVTNHSRVRQYYVTLQSMLIDTTRRLGKGDYSLDAANSNSSGSGWVVCYLKSDADQAKDKVKLKKQVKLDYLAELEVLKLTWVEATTADLAKQSEAEAVLTAQEGVNKLQADLLQLMNA